MCITNTKPSIFFLQFMMMFYFILLDHSYGKINITCETLTYPNDRISQSSSLLKKLISHNDTAPSLSKEVNNHHVFGRTPPIYLRRPTKERPARIFRLNPKQFSVGQGSLLPNPFASSLEIGTIKLMAFSVMNGVENILIF